MKTNPYKISFDYNYNDQIFFDEHQKRHWENIQKNYENLRSLCLDEIYIPVSASHKDWISARVSQHATTSLMRLLYLVESFRDATKNFNAVAAAVHIKAMAEIPFHLGYLVWILAKHSTFQSIKEELGKIAFGNKGKETGLTASSKISQKTFYRVGDKMMREFFKDDPKQVNILEYIYKEANATGHHNYEARMLVGLQNNGTWKAKDRKESFVFYCNNIFQFFLHCDAILSTSSIFMNALEYYLKNLPESLPDGRVNEDTFQKLKRKFLKITNKIWPKK